MRLGEVGLKMVLRVCRIGLLHRGPGTDIFSDGPLSLSARCRSRLFEVWTFAPRVDVPRRAGQAMPLSRWSKEANCAPGHMRRVPVKCMSKENTLSEKVPT